jgi:hypothetical protein
MCGQSSMTSFDDKADELARVRADLAARAELQALRKAGAEGYRRGPCWKSNQGWPPARMSWSGASEI